MQVLGAMRRADLMAEPQLTEPLTIECAGHLPCQGALEESPLFLGARGFQGQEELLAF